MQQRNHDLEGPENVKVKWKFKLFEGHNYTATYKMTIHLHNINIKYTRHTTQKIKTQKSKHF